MDNISVLNALQESCSLAGGKTAWAKNNGFSRQYVYDVISGKRALGEKILSTLGYERVVFYKKIEQGKSLYIFSRNNGECKIGISKNPNERKKRIEKEIKEPINIIKIFSGIKYPHLAERRAHLLLKEFHTKGEWFQVSSKQAIDIAKLSVDLTNKLARNGDAYIPMMPFIYKNRKKLKALGISADILLGTARP